jgi:RND family efflux transporter MFP subunit
MTYFVLHIQPYGLHSRLCSLSVPDMSSTYRLYQRISIAGMAFLAITLPCYAQTAKYHEEYEIQGFSQPARLSQVASSIPGIIAALQVTEGSFVNEGDCIVRLDHTVQDRKLELAKTAMESRGELESAEAELAAKESRVTRLRELRSRNHATTVEVQQAEEEFAVAKAGLVRAQDNAQQFAAEYRRLAAETDLYCIKAPFAGVVVQYNKQVGEYAGPGEPDVCIVADLSKLSVEFLVPRVHRGALSLHQPVNVLFTIGNEVVPGEITYISPFPNGETNTYTVKVKVDNRDQRLNAGERCLLQPRPDHDVEDRHGSRG